MKVRSVLPPLAVLWTACNPMVTTTDGGVPLAADGGLSTDAGVACSGAGTQKAKVACAAAAFLSTLSASQLAAVQFPMSDFATRTKWNNLPVGLRPRAGTQLGQLSAQSQVAANDLMTLSLNAQGQETWLGILRADDLLGQTQSGYGSGLYSIAIFGTPSESSDFELMFGGHHLAYNLHFKGSAFYPVPLHVAVEPKAAFTVNNVTFSPMESRANAMFAIYSALSATERTGAFLSGQTFSDVLVNPDLDYGKGASRGSKSAYPSARAGVLVSSLDVNKQALVTAAIEGWVRQFPPEVADQLIADYTAAYAETTFAWAGNATGPDKDVQGSYLRIDGPRVWVELAVPGGIVFRNATHYHSIFHDKQFDYAGEF